MAVGAVQVGTKHPIKKGGKYITTSDGKQVCFNFNNKSGCSTPCKAGRAHVCQYCLQPHRNSECGKTKGGGKGGGKQGGGY